MSSPEPPGTSSSIDDVLNRLEDSGLDMARIAATFGTDGIPDRPHLTSRPAALRRVTASASSQPATHAQLHVHTIQGSISHPAIVSESTKKHKEPSKSMIPSLSSSVERTASTSMPTGGMFIDSPKSAHQPGTKSAIVEDSEERQPTGDHKSQRHAVAAGVHHAFESAVPAITVSEPDQMDLVGLPKRREVMHDRIRRAVKDAMQHRIDGRRFGIERSSRTEIERPTQGENEWWEVLTPKLGEKRRERGGV